MLQENIWKRNLVFSAIMQPTRTNSLIFLYPLFSARLPGRATCADQRASQRSTRRHATKKTSGRETSFRVQSYNLHVLGPYSSYTYCFLRVYQGAPLAPINALRNAALAVML